MKEGYIHSGEAGCDCVGKGAHDHGKSTAVCACGHEHAHRQDAPKRYWGRIIVGAAIMAAGMVLQNTLQLNIWVLFTIFLAAYLILGYQVLLTAAKNIVHGKVFDENFLMTVATVGAFVLGVTNTGDFAEGVAVMLFYQIGETLSDLAVEKSKRSISSLMDIRPDYANVRRDGKIERVSPQEVAVGDIIIVKPYEKIPLDGDVVSGASALNTSALTGESMPREVAKGDNVLAGSINGGGLLEVHVEKTFGESTVAKILELVEHSGSKKAHTEKFITKFARYYTPIVCAGALVVAIIPSLITGNWGVWVYRALLFLVISCPCALVVSVPLSYFSGIGGASRKGILVKGASFMEALTQIREAVFDKTGTLTKGIFAVKEILPKTGIKEETVLKAAAIAEANSSHPIAKSVLEAYGKPVDEAAEYIETPGYGVCAKEKNGSVIFAGNARLMEENEIQFTKTEKPGTILYVAQNGSYLGSILIADEIKRDAKEAVLELKRLGISTTMLTGDSRMIADAVSEEIGIDTSYAELLPQDKVAALEKIQEEKGRTVFVGDGINDAPVLKRADVGIAMGGVGSDAAIEAADVVIMTDEPKKVAQVIRTARKTKTIVWQNIIFALAVKAVIMVLGILGFADMWWAVFADVGVTLIAVLNALRAMK